MTDVSRETDGVLEPFAEEVAEERRAKAEAEVIRLTHPDIPMMVVEEPDGTYSGFTLIRRDGETARARFGPDAIASTVRFTNDQWRVIEDTVARQHGFRLP